MNTGYKYSARKSKFRSAFPPALLLVLLISFELTVHSQTIGISTTGTTSYPTSIIGDNSVRTGNIGITTNIVQAANKFTVTGPMTLTSFSIYLSNSYTGNSMKFAVYPDNGGTPAGQALTGQTGGYSFTSGTGWKSFNLSSTDYIYIPAAGTYWLCFMGNASGGQVRRNNSSVDYYFTQTYSSGYPATFPSNPTSETAGTYSFYATGVQIKGYSKASKAVLPVNATFSSLSFYSHAAGNARLAIFNDAGGTPSAKQWESGDLAVTANDWTNVNISSGTPANLNLNAGTYWLAWQWNNTNNGPSYSVGVTGDGNYMIRTTYGSFPATWSGGISSTEKWSLYATYSCATQAPTTTTPVYYCQNETASPLTATGENLLWYTLPASGTGSSIAPTPVTAVVGTTSYYVSQTIGCEGPRAQIDVTVRELPVAMVSGQSNISCSSGNDGTIEITASGEAGPFYFSVDGGENWTSPAQTGPYTFDKLVANHPYRIKVKDANECISK